VFGCSLLIWELFTSLARQNQRQLSLRNIWYARTNYLHGTYIKVFDRESKVDEKLDLLVILIRKALETWQPTEILSDALHLWK
jgi:hypothetical protein